MDKLYNSRKWLRKRFLIDKKTQQEIADECGAALKTINRKLNEFNLIRRR